MKLIFKTTAVIIMIATCPVLVAVACADQTTTMKTAPDTEIITSIDKADAWINETVQSKDLKGKVVLVEFGTYTCINWIRTLPYIRAWSEKYKENGLFVIVVNTPEFTFERSIDNVRTAIKSMNINFPVAIDNHQQIWNAFSNQYWPALYLIDAKGKTRHHQFGEGEYEASEKMIQQLLLEAGSKNVDKEFAAVNDSGTELAADWNHLQSTENYLGYERTEDFAISQSVHDKFHAYTAPLNLLLNQWALSGEWKVQRQSILLNKPNGKIIYRFHARDLHLVVGPAVAGTRVRFRVLINGKAPGTSHGIDIDEQGNGKVSEQRMYQLIRQTTTVADCNFEIEFLDAGVEAFTFTFG